VKDVKDIVVACCDHGQFLPIARKLGEQVAKCYYWSPSEKSLRLVQEGIIGDGFEDIERVENIWDIKDKVDCFVFPDIGFAGLQKELIRQGYPVWGARDGDSLESNRGKFLKALKEMGMEVPPHKIIKGLTNLRLFLKDEEDKYVKISDWRGNFETFHWTNWDEGEGELDNYAVEFGATKELITFYVFDPIDTDIEDGMDTYFVNGSFPKIVLHGMENKDKSYIGCMTDWDDVPEQVREVSEQFAPALAEYDYRGFWASEVRILPDKYYFIDTTNRAPSPPHQLQTELWGNFADIIWQGANGNCIDPEPTAKFGVQALLSCSRNSKEWVSFNIPDKIKKNVKCGFCCEINGKLVFPPHQLETMCGYLVGTGDTIQEAITDLQDAVKELPSGMKCEDKSIAELLKELQLAEDKGIEFGTGDIPEPATVIE
jgi:hypothetical protein